MLNNLKNKSIVKYFKDDVKYVTKSEEHEIIRLQINTERPNFK